MELLYSMRRKPLKCEPPHFENSTDPEVTRPICTISTCNIIAFSSPTELSDTDGDTWGGHVYVCDLDTPWDSHKVTSTTYPISSLEWDSQGKQLLVTTTIGEVSVFGQKDFLLNEWTCLYTASFPGEHIIKSSFFHNGRRIVVVDKKPDAPITERIQMMRSAPTLKGFGGVPCEGVCVMTATGLLGVVTPQDGRALAASEPLRAQRDHLTCGDIAHKNGNLLVAGVCVSQGRACVRCALCVVTRAAAGAPAPRRVRLQLQPLPTVYLIDTTIPASITWSVREDTESLLIAGSCLTLWRLTERAHAVHKLLAKGPIQGSTTPGGGQKPGTDCFNTLVWQQTAAWPVERAVHVSRGAAHCVLASGRALHLLATDTHQYVCSRAVVTSSNDTITAGSPPKKTKYAPGTGAMQNGGPVVSCCSQSHLGGVVVCVDTLTQLHVYKLLQPLCDSPTSVAVQLACNTFEYALVGGWDCLDILLTLKPNIIEPVTERLTESFQRQPPAFQQYYYHSWLKLRIALCRMQPTTQASASCLTSLQMSSALWAAVSAALRPDDKLEDKPLVALLDELHLEHDKALLTLEAKTEPSNEALTLQALRRPLQRVIDIAYTALASVPHHNVHGYTLWTDASALQQLRRLIAVWRGAKLAALCRALARLAAGCHLPKQDLIEECAGLSAQAPARVWEALPRCAVCAPHGRAPPLYFEYGVEPEGLRYAPEPPAYLQCDSITPSLNMDSIRYMYVGGGARPARWRQCARCGARALPHAQPARHPLQRALDGRFLPECRCGGKWTLFSNI